MLDSINCEPYGYIKYEHDDLAIISINEFEDVKNNNKYPRYTKPYTIIINNKQIYNKQHNNDDLDFID